MPWSQEHERIMFIDLERAVQFGRTPLQELPANRKRRQSTIVLKTRGERLRKTFSCPGRSLLHVRVLRDSTVIAKVIKVCSRFNTIKAYG